MTPSRQSRWLAFLMYWLLRPVAIVFARPRFVRLIRWYIEAITPRPSRGTEVEPGPKGEWVRGPGVPKNTESAILYLHGSGYVVCSPKTHRGLVSRLSREAGLPAYSVDYRLAPEHPFPAAFDDTVEAYRHLVDAGYTKIVVAGDSAGGHLAISLVAALTEAELPTPLGLVLFSPLVDPTFETAAATSREARDPMFTAGAARRMLALYTAQADPADARLAVLSGEPEDMPPVLLHAGSREMLAADARALDDWLRRAGVDVRTTIWPGQVHVFQMFYDVVPEARKALVEAGAFIRPRVSAPLRRAA
ncbi:MAG: epsilon-lactone hydrolase [Solirubrobacteraceae bacterium]|nr:epsilon-lactone hydrolase [Solirubrobacteraceae bacterium]